MIPRICHVCGLVVRDAGVTSCMTHGATLISSAALHSLQDAKDPFIGKLVESRYRIVRCLGEGGYGRVYLTWHEELRRTVAMKVILPEHRETAEVWEAVIDAFRSDGMSNALIHNHPNVLQITDSGKLEGGSRFLVLELLRGHDLLSEYERGSIAPAAGAGYALQACRGLGAVHAARLVHRDIKLDNLFLHDPSPPDRPGSLLPVVKVIDFGVACEIGKSQGAYGGTPEFMAPEQFFPILPVDERSDIFALGVTLYFMLARRFPFTVVAEVDRLNANLRARLLQDPQRLCDARPGLDISREFEAVIMRTMEREPRARYGTTTELCAAIEATPEGRAATGKHNDFYRDITSDLDARVPSLDLPSGTLPILYKTTGGATTWGPFASEDAQITVLPGRIIKVDPSFRLHVEGRPAAISHLVPEDTIWEAQMRRKRGDDIYELHIHGGYHQGDHVEFDLGEVGRFRAQKRYHSGLLALLAPRTRAAVIICLI